MEKLKYFIVREPEKVLKMDLDLIFQGVFTSVAASSE